MTETTPNISAIPLEEESVACDAIGALREYSSRCTSESPDEALKFLTDFIGVEKDQPQPEAHNLFGQLADKIDAEYVPRDVYDAIVEQRETISKQKDAAESQIRAVEAQIQAIASERDARHMKNLRYHNECSALQKKCNRLTSDVAIAMHERDSFHEKLDLLTEKHNKLARELENAHNDNRTLQSSYDAIAKDLDAAQQATQDTQARNDDLLAEIERLNQSNDKSDAQVVELTRAQSVLKQHVAALTEERDIAVKERSAAKQRIRELAAQYQSVSNKNQDAEQLEALKKQYDAQIEELKNQIRDFENEVESLQTRVSQTNAAYENAQEKARIACARENAVRQELINIKQERDDAIKQAKEATDGQTHTNQQYDDMLMAERGRFNAAMRGIRRKLIDAGVNSSIINVAFAGIKYEPKIAHADHAASDEDIDNQKLIDSILASA